MSKKKQVRKRTPVHERVFNKSIIPTFPDGRIDHNACWIWQGGKNNIGYGLIRSSNEEGMIQVTKAVSRHFNCSYDTEVHHSCDNKLCVNPNHLISGNAKNRYEKLRKEKGNWMQPSDPFRKCSVCGVTTYYAWFSRKHKNC